MVKISKMFASIWRKSKTFTVTILFLILFPLIVLLCLPIYLVRYIVNKTHGILYPHEGKILSTKSAVFASDSIYEKPKCNLLVMFVFDGHVELSKLQSTITNFMLNTKNKSGGLLYPELQQHIQRWMGFYFWRWVPNFEFRKHVNIYEGEFRNQIITEEIMPMLVNELTLKPFEREQSPWEVILINRTNVKTYQNYYLHHGDRQKSASTIFITDADELVLKDTGNPKDAESKKQDEDENTNLNLNIENENENEKSEQSVAFFRLHHALADGISIRALLMDLVGYKMKDVVTTGTNAQQQTPKSKIRDCKKIMKMLSYPIRAPFETIGALLDSSDVNEWHLAENKLSGELRGATTEPLSVDFIKNVKNYHGVTFASIVLAAVSGGIRNFMVEQDVKVPHVINCLTPLPMPGHSEKLRNHLTAAAIKLPLGCDTAATRLAQVHKNLIRLKKSVVPQTNYLAYPILGGLFPFMTQRLFRHNFTTALMSSFQGPEEKIHFVDHDIEDMAFAGGLLMGRLGIGISLLSYNGTFRVLVGVDKNIIPTYEGTKKLVQKIYEEFFILRDMQTV